MRSTGGEHPTRATCRSDGCRSCGRPTEVDDLNGEIVRLAEANGIRAPINRAIVDAVHAAEREQRGSPGHTADRLKSLMGL